MLKLFNPTSSKKFLLCISLAFLAGGRAQNSLDSAIDGHIHDLVAVWDRHNNLTFNHLFVNDTLRSGTDFQLFAGEEQDRMKQLRLAMNKQEQLIYKKNIGMQLVGGYQQNLNNPAIDPNEIVVFRQKLQVGLDWDLFSQGLYENRARYKQLKYENKAIQYQRPDVLSFQQRSNKEVISLFNTTKLKVLATRKQMLDQQKQIIDRLYALKQITTDSYIRLIQNQTDAEGQTYLYGDYNSAAERLGPGSAGRELPPLVDIDIEKLFRLTEAGMADSAVQYFMQAQTQQGNYFLRDLSLKASVKYNFYDLYGSKVPNRSYVSVGMNFSVPLAFNYSNKKELNRLQAELIEEKSKSLVTEDQNYFFINTFYEYRSKLRQYFNLLQKRRAYEELIRTEQVKQKMSDIAFNPNAALYILSDYWNTAIDLLDLKQDMYKLLVSINAKLPSYKISDFVKPVDKKYFRPGDKNQFKAVYIWSDVFKNHDIKLISDYCALNEFTHLIISYNPGRDYTAKVNEFISKNYTRHLALMVSSNKLLINQNISSYLDSLKKAVDLTFVQEIHLDIEPHAMDGFKENKEEYFKKYLLLLKQAKQFTDKNRLELSVSIPLHYPAEVLKEVFASCSHVYLMTYENVKPEHISEKTKEEMALDPDKVVIALRTKDFNSRADMDQHFKTIQAKKMAYHDLDDLISFDKKSINNTNNKEK